MRRRTAIIIAALGMLAIPASSSSRAIEASDKAPHLRSCDARPATFHLHRARELLKRAYALERWEDPTPAKRSELDAMREHKRCIVDDELRAKITALRERLEQEFSDYRAGRLVTPYPGPNGTFWAIPAYIVECESGFDFTPDFGLTFGGAYGILVSTWHLYGGGKWASQANYAPPYAQHIVASRIWHDVGPSAWACA